VKLMRTRTALILTGLVVVAATAVVADQLLDAQVEELRTLLEPLPPGPHRDVMQKKLDVTSAIAEERRQAAENFQPPQSIPGVAEIAAQSPAHDLEPERGIIADPAPLYPDFFQTNQWQDELGGRWWFVAAGGPRDAPQTGMVYVGQHSASTTASQPPDLEITKVVAPGQPGLLTILGVDGGLVRLQAENGSIFFLDVQAKRFVTQ
jgi:hypothetical protein